MQMTERILEKMKDGRPWSAPELVSALRENRKTLNKTTVYRALETLADADRVTTVDFGDGVKRYEAAGEHHHHHVVCTSCGAMEDVKLDEDLERQEKAVERKTGFTAVRHALEFFGLCRTCR